MAEVTLEVMQAELRGLEARLMQSVTREQEIASSRFAEVLATYVLKSELAEEVPTLMEGAMTEWRSRMDEEKEDVNRQIHERS